MPWTQEDKGNNLAFSQNNCSIRIQASAPYSLYITLNSHELERIRKRYPDKDALKDFVYDADKRELCCKKSHDNPQAWRNIAALLTFLGVDLSQLQLIEQRLQTPLPANNSYNRLSSFTLGNEEEPKTLRAYLDSHPAFCDQPYFIQRIALQSRSLGVEEFYNFLANIDTDPNHEEIQQSIYYRCWHCIASIDYLRDLAKRRQQLMQKKDDKEKLRKQISEKLGKMANQISTADDKDCASPIRRTKIKFNDSVRKRTEEIQAIDRALKGISTLEAHIHAQLLANLNHIIANTDHDPATLYAKGMLLLLKGLIPRQLLPQKVTQDYAQKRAQLKTKNFPDYLQALENKQQFFSTIGDLRTHMQEPLLEAIALKAKAQGLQALQQAAKAGYPPAQVDLALYHQLPLIRRDHPWNPACHQDYDTLIAQLYAAQGYYPANILLVQCLLDSPSYTSPATKTAFESDKLTRLIYQLYSSAGELGREYAEKTFTQNQWQLDIIKNEQVSLHCQTMLGRNHLAQYYSDTSLSDRQKELCFDTAKALFTSAYKQAQSYPLAAVFYALIHANYAGDGLDADQCYNLANGALMIAINTDPNIFNHCFCHYPETHELINQFNKDTLREYVNKSYQGRRSQQVPETPLRKAFKQMSVEASQSAAEQSPFEHQRRTPSKFKGATPQRRSPRIRRLSFAEASQHVTGDSPPAASSSRPLFSRRSIRAPKEGTTSPSQSPCQSPQKRGRPAQSGTADRHGKKLRLSPGPN